MDLISQRLADEELRRRPCRAVELLEKHFPKLQLANVARWRERFPGRRAGTARNARAAAGRTQLRRRPRRRDVRRRDSCPTPAMREVCFGKSRRPRRKSASASRRRAPSRRRATPDWAAARVDALVNPRLVEMVDFGAEGGVYASRFGELATSDAGLETALDALARGPATKA